MADRREQNTNEVLPAPCERCEALVAFDAEAVQKAQYQGHSLLCSQCKKELEVEELKIARLRKAADDKGFKFGV